MNEEVICVIDVGRTNKKILLFNREYQVVYEEETQLEFSEDDDGFPCEDIDQLTSWLKDAFKKAFAHKATSVKAVNFSGYGATLIHLADSGKPTTPLYDYMRPFPEDLASQFYDENGGEEVFCVETASPAMGFLNSGFQIYWLKKTKPKIFRNIKFTLHLPQYLSYILTRKTYSEKTSFGCHTMLWDFINDRSHEWIYREKLHSLFPPMANSKMQHSITFKGNKLICGVGIHDSSAALMPYLLQVEDPFILMSTGTWSISFNPFNPAPLTMQEIRQDCTMYMNYEGVPVKASRLYLGHEHDYWERQLAKFFKKELNYHRNISLDPALIGKLLEENSSMKKFYPQTMTGTGPMPQAFKEKPTLGLFNSYEEAYHQLMIDLVALQVASLKLIMNNSEVKKVFISGGFTANDLYLKLLASSFPKLEFYTSAISRSTALGAALVMHTHWNQETEFTTDATFNYIKPMRELFGMMDYQLV